MAEITGANTSAGLTLSATMGTVIQATAGDKILVDPPITHNKNNSVIMEAPVGSGAIGKTGTDPGDNNPSASFKKVLKSDDAGIKAIAAFAGVETLATIPGGVTATFHSITNNAASITNYANFAMQADTSNVIEYTDIVFTKLELSFKPNDYVRTSFDMLASQRLITGGSVAPTNTYASLAAATEIPGIRFITRDISYLLLNAQAGGALSTSTDVIPFTEATLTLNRGWKYMAEARNAPGKGTPIVDGDPPYTGTLKVVLARQSGLVYQAAVDAGTEYKGSIQVVGAVISGPTKYGTIVNLPRLKVTKDPDFPINAGINPITVEFEVLIATANPTGMFDIYPHFGFTNVTSTKSWDT